MNEEPLKTGTSDGDEVAHLDDQVIGKAFRWSLIGVVVVCLGTAAGVLYARRKPPAPAPKITAFSVPLAATHLDAGVPNVPFQDVTSSAGIHFVHNNGADGGKLLPETMGSGVAFLDFDNDNAQDLLFINSTSWPWHPSAGKPTLALYHNDGKGGFQDATTGSGLDISFYGMGVAVGDYDNDGFTDVLITGMGGNRLFRNLGSGKFQEMTSQAGWAGRPKKWGPRGGGGR